LRKKYKNPYVKELLIKSGVSQFVTILQKGGNFYYTITCSSLSHPSYFISFHLTCFSTIDFIDQNYTRLNGHFPVWERLGSFGNEMARIGTFGNELAQMGTFGLSDCIARKKINRKARGGRS
jgi:hypothetical protein